VNQTVTTVRRASVTTDLALVATFAALVAVCSLVSAPIVVGGVPITLQTFAVLLAGVVLGARRAFLAIALYIVVGLVGVPVFAGATGGFGVLAGPSVGYLLSFPFAAAVAGGWLTLAQRRGWRPVAVHAAVGVVLATLVVYAAGVPVLAWRTGMSLHAAFTYNLGFVPFDAVKAALAVIVGLAVLRAFPDLRRRA